MHERLVQIMDCREFGLLTKDFIFDNIRDNKIIMEYLEHAKVCEDCHDELEVTYSMFRSLGDVAGPDGKDESADYMNELSQINEYYEEEFQREKRIKILKVSVAIIILVIGIIAGICLLLEIY